MRRLYFPAVLAVALASLSVATSSSPAMSAQPPLAGKSSVASFFLIPVAEAPRESVAHVELTPLGETVGTAVGGGFNAVPVPVGPPTTADPNTQPSSPTTNPSASTDPVGPQTAAPTTKPVVRNLVITGHGWGHGRGLGQWGAYGYAVDKGWDYRKILSHFYGNTAVGQLNPASSIGVRLLAQDNKPVAIYQSTGRLFLTINGETVGPDASTSSVSGGSVGTSSTTSPATGPVGVGGTIATIPGALPSDSQASTSVPLSVNPSTVPPIIAPSALPPGTASVVRVQMIGAGKFAISEATSCAGPWSPRGTVSTSAVSISTGAATDKSDPATMLQLCTSSGRRVYRGDLVAADAKPNQQLVNQVNMEDYLRGVVPAEVPSGWGSKPNGMEALKAQAVAARSYAAAEKRPGLANTCDSTACQVYVGRGEFRGGVFVSFEDTRTDDSVKATIGEIRFDKSGAVVRTEFSSSTGGQTAPGAFPPVVDEGDKTTDNPHSTWTVTLTAARLEAGRKLGAFRDIEITLRDGVGPYGGRVQNLNLVFEKGKVSYKAGEFLRAYNLQSTLFNPQVVEGNGAPVGGTLPPLPTVPDDGTTGLANPNQVFNLDTVPPATLAGAANNAGSGSSATTKQNSKAKATSSKKASKAIKPPTTQATRPKNTVSVTPVPVGVKPQPIKQSVAATTPPKTKA